MNFFYNPKVILAFKVLVFVLMTWFIVDQLFIKADFKNQCTFFIHSLITGKWYLLFLAIVLMPLNWFLEVIKWRQLIKTKSSFSELIKATLAGVTMGFITPGRGGEFIGRVMFLEEADKSKVFYLSSIGGIAQTAATLMVGIFFVYAWNNNPFLSGIAIGLSIAFLLLYFRFDLLNRFISSSSFLQKYSLTISEDELPEISVQVNVLFLSLLRYAVYLSQYILVLLFLNISGSPMDLAIYTGVFLLAQTFSPLMPVLDIAFRGGSALFVFANLSPNPLALLCATTFMWLLNLVIPALAGYFFILRKRRIVHVA